MTELKPPYWEHQILHDSRSVWIFHGADHLLLWASLHDDGVWRVELSSGYDYPGPLMRANELAVLGQGLAMLAHGDKPTGVWLT